MKSIAKHPDGVPSGTSGGRGWLREGSLEQNLFAGGGKDGKPEGVCFRSFSKPAQTEQEIKSIRIPMLILFGDRNFFKKRYVEPLQRVWKDWPKLEIKDADHIT